MLTFDTLIQYLDVQQETLDNLYKQNLSISDENVYIKYINNNNNDTFSLPASFIKIFEEFVDYYYIKNTNNNSFIYSILYCIDEIFISNLNKDQYIIDLRKKLCYDLENKNLYRQFNYVKSRKFKKDKIQSSLMQFNKPIDDIIKQYISDYFSINIFIFSFNNSDIDINYILSNNDSDESNPFKPTLFLLYDGKYHLPILHKNYDGILLYSQINLINKIYNIYINKNNKVKKIKKSINQIESKLIDQNNQNNQIDQINQIDQKDIIETKKDTGIKLKSIKKMLLKELQELAKDNEIDIQKDSINGKKKLLKTKDELYCELLKI